jgi:DNA-binding PadR family transcriptional regulator
MASSLLTCKKDVAMMYCIMHGVNSTIEERAMDRTAADHVAQWHEHGLTATSFAVLGLLAIREWTTYELAHQMQRSFSYFWPRAERRIYDEPKRLAGAGYVQARREVVGRRPRTCWNITDDGRDALRQWLAQPPTVPPALEFEGMLKVFLAESGDKKQLLGTLAQIADAAEDQQSALREMCAGVAATGGQFPQRVHLNALAMEYVLAVTELTAQWARHAQEIVGDWRGTGAPGPAARAHAQEFFRAQATAS